MWGVEKLWRAEEEKIVLDLPSVSINTRQTHILHRVPAENTRQTHILRQVPAENTRQTRTSPVSLTDTRRSSNGRHAVR